MYGLRAAGHEVLFIAESSPGIDDTEVLDLARREKALLPTAVKDFGELILRNHEPHFGVLLIRSRDRSLEESADDTLVAISRFGHELLNQFSVLADGVLRIRKNRF